MVETMPPSMAAPGAKTAYSDRPIEDIVENLMGIPLPQRSQRYQEMYNAAQVYYQVLQEANQVSIRRQCGLPCFFGNGTLGRRLSMIPLMLQVKCCSGVWGKRKI